MKNIRILKTMVILIATPALLLGGNLLPSRDSQEEAKAAANRSTETVWQHHIEEWGHRDLDGILSDYDEASLIVVNGQVYRGLAQIKFVFQSLFQIFDAGENRIDPALVHGRLVYITWHFTPAGLPEFFGTDSFVIEDGKIRFQTIASPLYEKFSLTGGVQ